MTAPDSTTSKARTQRVQRDRAEERIAAHTWDHNTNQQNRANLVRLGGRWYADIRKAVKCGPDRWILTGRGITVPLQELDHLELAVRRLKAKARERGL